MNTLPSNTSQRGAALILALTMLALFTVLGTLYVSHMTTELARADLGLREARARQTAQAGVAVALGELERALQSGQLQQVLDRAIPIELPAYKGVFDGTGIAMEAVDNRTAKTEVTISDESAKANPNYLPASALQRLLGVEGDTARAIASSLPREDSTGGAWIYDLDDLLQRGLLTEAQFLALDTSLLTTCSSVDPARPQDSLNINTAAPAVLAAILDVPLEQADAIAAKRPFSNLEALSAAAGKDPATFNVKPDPANPYGLPAPLALKSRCFRIVSRAEYGTTEGGRQWNRATGEVEAVVVFDDQGKYQFVRWNARRGIG